MSLYVILLSLHNIVRWLVLLFGVLALVRTLPGLGGRRAFGATERRVVVMFMSSVHLQLLLGLLLFAYVGMQNIPAFADAPRAGFRWEHVGLGVLIAVFATLANTLSKRAASDQGKFRAAAVWTGLALVLSLAAIPWWRPLLRLFTT
ncbi:hypothetical protein [Deinococcus hohokamensis]|uniref:Cytochrome B n=1 Tax=Deinococcus hohokamensis TaxID=309883 RepID=A0ABV9IBS4_9DEIO